MKRLSLLIPIFLMRCAFSAEAQQPLVGMIEGIVRNQAMAPLAGVSMMATNLDSNAIHAGVSDRAGVYQFVDLPPGRYSILAHKRGYTDLTVDLVTVAPGEKVKVADITMRASP